MERIDGKRAKQRREDLGISQKEVARRIERAGFGEINYQSIQQLESGDVKKPSYSRYLPEALETTWEYLTGKTDNPVGVVNGALGNHVRGSETVRSQVREPNEGNHMIAEISQMLGRMEGRLETRFDARFDKIDERLEDHGRRIDALEGRQSGPQKGRRR